MGKVVEYHQMTNYVLQPPPACSRNQMAGPNMRADCSFVLSICVSSSVVLRSNFRERTQTGSVEVFGKGRKPEVRLTILKIVPMYGKRVKAWK